jgi:outer membrane protein
MRAVSAYAHYDPKPWEGDMKVYRLGLTVLILASILPAKAQIRETYHGLLTKQVNAAKLSEPQHLRDYVSEGKLRLSLKNAIRLTFENNSDIRIKEVQVENAKFSLLRAYAPFDPLLQNTSSVNRFSYPGYSEIQGEGTFDSLIHSNQLNYTQTFQTGTNLLVGLGTTRNSSNSSFYFINPNYQSVFNLQLTQPLLRNRWRFENRAPLLIARKNLQQSRASFEAQVSDALLRAVTQYWAVVQARGTLGVAQKSLEAAEASYQHDKRALELGALPPLDIYRSESEVASRRVQVIQAEYTLKQVENDLRLTIGADQDTYAQALDLDLTEKPEPEGELRVIDAGTALQEALTKRPELQAAQHALDNDDTRIRLAQNHLQPDLSLAAIYQSNGIGGNQFSLTSGQLISRGGLGTSFSQLFGFGFPSYGAILTLNLPVKNRAAQADVGTALVTRHSDLYSMQQWREQIGLDVSNAVHQLELAKLTLAAGKTALDLAQKSLAAEQRKYQLGAQSVFFQLDAQTRLALAEANLLQAQVNYQTAIAAVDHATGSLLQSYQVEIADLTR